MEFKDLPLKVQEIAAQCLADKIRATPGFAEGVVKKEPVKNQAHQIREAFIELYSPHATSLIGADGEVFRVMLGVENERKKSISPLYLEESGHAAEFAAHAQKDSHHHPSSDLQGEDLVTQAVRGLCSFVLHLTQKEER